MKILDTDTCIAILRGVGQVIERRAEEPEEVATTWVTAAELYFGAAKSAVAERNRSLVDAFLATLPVLRPDLAAAQIFGEAKALLQRAGTPLADADLFIAATAIACRAAIVTGNQRHFRRIPGVELEDWIRG
ncbi:MAG: type II toxin-antitoxin system VapC family toxin [Oligoflexia bacterium]|nr:type II toxin-antitoxin system VapC family toxin [Oligoflexia bacterium]